MTLHVVNELVCTYIVWTEYKPTTPHHRGDSLMNLIGLCVCQNNYDVGCVMSLGICLWII